MVGGLLALHLTYAALWRWQLRDFQTAATGPPMA